MEVILGPPGTGKTSTLLGIVDEELARGTPPDRIGYVSFTRRAADEAITRACENFSLTRSALPHFRTLHSMAFRQLGLSRGDVLEGARLRAFGEHAGVRISGRWSEDGTLTGFDLGDRIIFMENLARTRCVPLRQLFEENDDGLPWHVLDRVSRTLAEYKAAEGLMDFTDMLTRFVESGIRLRLDVLVVDEGQDLSALQWRMVRQLAAGARRVAVAGDDDQGIYRWAGADVDTLIEMEGDVRVLAQSWRVPPVIQSLAGGLIERIRHRRPKTWKAREGSEGEVEYVPDITHADVSEGDTLILARNTYVLREQVEPELRRQGIVFERDGHPSVSRSVLGAITAWEALRAGEEVSLAAAREAYTYLASGSGVARGHKTLSTFGDDPDRRVTMDELRRDGGLLADGVWHDAMEKLPQTDMSYILRARQRGERLLSRPRVRVSTIHGAKGGQADHVVVMKEMARRTYADMRREPEDEVRVWYVGVTRAREKVTIVESQVQQACPWL
jgi:DNA helicase-2/ATP-dependent DNA helicase PcrA